MAQLAHNSKRYCIISGPRAHLLHICCSQNSKTVQITAVSLVTRATDRWLKKKFVCFFFLGGGASARPDEMCIDAQKSAPPDAQVTRGIGK